MSPAHLAAVADNPMIDVDWYAGEMSALTSRLCAAFPHVAPETVAVAIDLATQRIAMSARIPNYLPVLIERDVRAQLATYGEPTPVLAAPPVAPVPGPSGVPISVAPVALPPVILPPVPVAPAPQAPPQFTLSTAEPIHPPAF